ncbi:hypothetical protein DTO027B9_2725 [Paecilomyces variotii]|nr:hypothetical protein DTO027B9_2725 [Paecilomyces variotii]
MTTEGSDASSVESHGHSFRSSEAPRFSSIVRADDEQSPDMARPARSAERTRPNYGSIGPSSSSIQESCTDRDPQDAFQSSSGRGQPSQSPSIAPMQADRARKPAVLRRMSSKKPGPHRGQEFSTDDDIAEVVQDTSLPQAAIPEASPRMRPLRERSSTIRRRGNATPSALARHESSRNVDTEPGPDEPDIDDSGEPSSSRGQEDDQREEGDSSDAESFTLKDRQDAINETHPFGIRLWKPALYKKNRSVDKTAEGDIHSSPGGRVNNLLFLVNLLWTFFFGWWLAIAAFIGAVACFLFAFSPSAVAYGKVFLGLSRYLIYPFGSFVRLDADENYAEEDEGEGRSISEYEQWQSGDIEHGRLFFGPPSNRSLIGRRRNSIDSAISEHDSLLGRPRRGEHRERAYSHAKRRLFGRGEWTLGRVVFFTFYYFLVGPLMLAVSLVCWMLVFWIPMGRVMLILFDHLRRHPLALSFHSDTTSSRSSSSSSILLCTYRAAGTRYWKYTVDGTNIFFINLLGVVLFVIVDYWILGVTLGIDSWLTHPGLIFTLALISIIPLAYFIGQAVASISAQSSMGLGAAINAFFSTIVEVYLYCVALSEGKAQLVEGSIIGSIFAGILFLPGLSMCFGAIKRKTQRFNVKSAGVTSTMLLFAVIAAFGPTLFYQIYGSHELNCRSCVNPGRRERDCRRCYFSQVPAVNDKFFIKAVQPYSWFSAVFLFLSYVIGLWFTLRTHAALIWATENDEKKAANSAMESSLYDGRIHELANGPHPTSSSSSNLHKNSIRDSQLYKRILGQSLRQVGLSDGNLEGSWTHSDTTTMPENLTPHVVPPRGGDDDDFHSGLNLRGLSDEENERLARQVAEVAATAAAVAARDATRSRKPSFVPHGGGRQGPRHAPERPTTGPEEHEDMGIALDHGQSSGGHDAPNWSKAKSSIILLVATFMYAVIAEMLVRTVDVVLQSIDIDEKFLGITLFALVPNTTEFLNAISFAMNGNIALSMEIGSAYALQVCLLQIPALVLFSAVHSRFIEPSELLSHSFNLIFPQWDMVTVILCVFLLSYVYGEGKSNYFKGSILVLTYLTVVIGFYLSGYNTMETMEVDQFNTLAVDPGHCETFRTLGRGSSGPAY